MTEFSSLPLAISQTMQLQSVRYGHVRLYSRLIGYVDGHSIMVTSPVDFGELGSVIAGDEFICRAFGGKYAFAFHTHVLRVVKRPFRHLFLAYPARVEKAVVRRATRVGVELRGCLTTSPSHGEKQVEATVSDISLSGAGATCPVGLAQVGELVAVQVLADGESLPRPFEAHAVVRNIRPIEGRADHCRYGLEFTGLSAQQSQALVGIIQRHLLAEA